jgi:membrane protein required for colicin V production
MVYFLKLFVFMMNLDFLPETNWVDIIVVIFLIRGGYIGYNLGFSVELFKLLGAVVATVLSLIYYADIGNWLTSHSFLSLQVANFISFLALFFSLLLVFKLVRTLLFRILHLELFGGLERWGGFTLGLGRSLIFASLFVFALTLLPVTYLKESVEEKSLSGAYLKELAPKVVDFIVMFRPKEE